LLLRALLHAILVRCYSHLNSLDCKLECFNNHVGYRPIVHLTTRTADSSLDQHSMINYIM